MKYSKIRIICTAAILAAISCVIAYCCKILTFGSIRITLENLPIILCGYLFGPVFGFACGAASDLLNSCVFYGIGGINPIITFGAGCVGLFSGLFSRLLKGRSNNIRLVASISSAHIVGNMIVKSIGLHIYYSYPYKVLLLRIPLYLAIGTIEYFLLKILLKNSKIGGGLK